MTRGLAFGWDFSPTRHRLATSRALVSLLLQNNRRDFSGQGCLCLRRLQIPAFHCFREQLGPEDAYDRVKDQGKARALEALGVSSRGQR